MTTIDQLYVDLSQRSTKKMKDWMNADGALLVSVVRNPADEKAPVQICVTQDGFTLAEMIGIVHRLAGDVNTQMQQQGLEPPFDFKVNGQHFFQELL